MTNAQVVLINAFEVHEEEDESFLATWERARAYLSTQDGYVSTRLHRSFSPNADFRYVNVGVWESARAFEDATSKPEFRNAKMPFPFHASLYAIIREHER